MAFKKKKVIKHLKKDIKSFKHEAQEDRELIKSLKDKKHEKKETKKHEKKEHQVKKHEKKLPKGKAKVKKVLHEYKEGELHSGSKKGPVVKDKKQAVAIALSEARKAGAKIPKKKSNKSKK